MCVCEAGASLHLLSLILCFPSASVLTVNMLPITGGRGEINQRLLIRLFLFLKLAAPFGSSGVFELVKEVKLSLNTLWSDLFALSLL